MYIKKVSCIAVVMLVSLCTANEVIAKEKKEGKSQSKIIRAEVESQIVATAKYYNLDPKLLMEIVEQESGFNPRATSNKGARGLMQMIDSTARRFGVSNSYDSKESLDGGSRYLVWLLRRYKGRLDLALAGYNAGEGAVERYGNRVPPYKETQAYVRSITLKYLSRLGQRRKSSSAKTKTFSKKELNQLAKLDILLNKKQP